MYNANGYPSSRAVGRKIKAYESRLRNKDVVVILETGINKNVSMTDLSDTMEVTNINHMPDVEKEQYQHIGSGTAILTNKNINYMHTRDIFNSHKKITQIMETGFEKRRWIIGALHTQNDPRREKWMEIENYLEDLNLQYTEPKIIYIDVNRSIQTKLYIEEKSKWMMKGWKIIENNEWTRKGQGK